MASLSRWWRIIDGINVSDWILRIFAAGVITVVISSAADFGLAVTLVLLGGLIAIPAAAWAAGRPREVLDLIDSEAAMVIKRRRAQETAQLSRSATSPLFFAPPPFNPSGSLAKARGTIDRNAFHELQRLGVVRPVRYDLELEAHIYEWTGLGEEVVRLMERRDTRQPQLSNP